MAPPALSELLASLRDSAELSAKRDIGLTVGQLAPRGAVPQQDAPWARPGETFFSHRPGDDCAALPNPSGTGHLLFAIEGLIPAFVEADPWFAGWSAVMVNLSDVAAMGGTPTAVTNALWARDHDRFRAVWDGMQAASDAYGVPIVGGHTHTHARRDALAVSVLGHADALLTSFDLAPGDTLLYAVDLAGAFREPNDFWNAATGSTPDKLRADLALLPNIATAGRAHAAKDVSNAGLLGTLVMLLETSGCGALVDLAAVPRPGGVAWDRWLAAFPSYGYVLGVKPAHTAAVIDAFAQRGLACAAIGSATPGSALGVTYDQATEVFYDWKQTPLMSLGPDQP